MKHLPEILITIFAAGVFLYITFLNIECIEKGGQPVRGFVVPVACAKEVK